MYQYESRGVVSPGESAFVFTDWDEGIPDPVGSLEQINQIWQKKAEKEQEMYQRLAQLTEQSFEYLGQYYIRTVDGGSRTFEYKTASWVSRTDNTVLQLLGLFLMVFSAVLSLGRKALLRF